MNQPEIVSLLVKRDEKIAKLEEENRRLKEDLTSFTWADLNAIAYDEWREHGGLSNFDAFYVNWLEDNFYPPNKRKNSDERK